MIRDGHKAGWFPASFFALGIPVALIQLLPKSSFLTVDEDGIEFCTLFRKCRLKWNDISEFGIYSRESIGIGKTVGFNYSPSYERLPTMRLLNKTLIGFEAALPDTYGLRAEELASLLSDFHSTRAKAS